MHPSVVASGDGRRYAIPTPFLLVNRALQPCLICDGSKLITARDKAALGILALLVQGTTQRRPKRALAVIFPCRMYVTAGRAFYPLGMDAALLSTKLEIGFESSKINCVFVLSTGPETGSFGKRASALLDAGYMMRTFKTA